MLKYRMNHPDLLTNSNLEVLISYMRIRIYLHTESVDDSCRDDLSVPLTGDGGLGAAIECKEPKDEYEGSEADQRDGVGRHLGLALQRESYKADHFDSLQR